MKKQLSIRLIFILQLFLIAVNCKIEEPIKSTGEVPEIITEDIIMKDFTVNPIKEYAAYFQQGSRVSGIPEEIKTPGEIENINFEINIEGNNQLASPSAFFIKSEILYFLISLSFAPEEEGGESLVVTKYCKQTDGALEYLSESNFPAAPGLMRIVGDHGDYKFSTGDYEGQTISIAERDYQEKMIFIDNFMVIEGGCLLSVQEGRGSARPEGLLFWPEGKNNMDKWKDAGRLWR